MLAHEDITNLRQQNIGLIPRMPQVDDIILFSKKQ